MALSFEIAGAQIDGARDYQEDAFLVTHLTDSKGRPSALVIVADGMGGHAAGNVASNMAVQAFNKHVTSNYPSDNISEVLNESVLKANHSISETIKETPALDGMGCTMVAALLEVDGLCWASVGDSHLYLLRNRKLTKINADHSYGGFLDAMAAAGTPVDPEPGLSRNMLMSAVTGSDISDIDCPASPFELKAGDKIIVCSDGMDTLSEGKIIQYSDWADTPKECAEALLNAVEEAEMPKQDNTTAVIISVIEKAGADEAVTPVSAETEAVEVDDEDEDITDRNAVHAESIEAAPPPPEPSPPEAPTETPAIPEEEIEYAGEVVGKDNKGMMIGIAAGVVIVIALGIFFMVGGEKPEEVIEPDETISVTEPEKTELFEPAPEETVEAEEPEAVKVEAVEAEIPAEVSEPDTEPQPPAVEKTEAPAKVVATGKEFSDPLKDGTSGPVMIEIPAGSYEMGSPDSSRFAEERPRHSVKYKKYAINKHEITFAEYDKFAKATDRKIPDNMYMDRGTHPVIFVSWDDAYYYTKWLAEQTGGKYRLPSEAEWEYAASGGKSTPFWWGFNEESGKAHCFGCASQFDPRKPTKVGSFPPNQFGVHDTAGNVAEWVHDCWHNNYEGAPVDGSVWEGGDCSLRIVRGGSYISPQQSIRTAKRDKFKSDTGYDHVGIRVIKEID